MLDRQEIQRTVPSISIARKSRSMQMTRALHERVFAWLTLADERNLAATLVAGSVRFERPR